MKVIAYIDKNTVLAEVSPSDLAGIAGLSQYELRNDLPENCMNYNGFSPKIVGQEIEPGKIYDEAVEALGVVAKAQKATKNLQEAADVALSFFEGRKGQP